MRADNATAQAEVTRYVRENSANVAINQPSRASSTLDGLLPRYAFDRFIDTGWGSETSDNQTLTVDLMSLYNVCKVAIIWEHASEKDYDIQVSRDEVHWATVWSKIDGYAKNMNTVEILLVTNVTCRYV